MLVVVHMNGKTKENRQTVRADVSQAWSMRSQPFNRASIDPG